MGPIVTTAEAAVMPVPGVQEVIMPVQGVQEVIMEVIMAATEEVLTVMTEVVETTAIIGMITKLCQVFKSSGKSTVAKNLLQAVDLFRNIIVVQPNN